MMTGESIEIRPILQDKLPQALALVERVFMRFEAPDYAPEGIETFRTFLQTKEAVSALTFYGAFSGALPVGVLATRGNSHIALFFVDEDHQGQGIGRALFSAAKSACKTDLMKVNSSPYAVEIYRRLGFTPISAEQTKDGIRFTPMKCIL